MARAVATLPTGKPGRETGIIVEITHRLFTGNSRPIKVFVGRPVGGQLRLQRRECLDVRWRNPGKVSPSELAFGGDRKALRLWAEIKSGKGAAGRGSIHRERAAAVPQGSESARGTGPRLW